MTFNLTKNFLLVTICLVICLPSALSFWRLPCAKPITVQRIDPIVANGTSSGHVHTVMGASAFHASASAEEIKKSKCSTCTVIEDNSNYWIGALYYQHPNGTLEAVQQSGGMLVYYLQRYSPDSKELRAFPPGFRMIAGDPMKRTSDHSLKSRAISYNCIDYKHATPETGAFPQKNCPQGLRTQVFFPSCWDGVNLDSPDHRSHVAYPDQMDNGKCPSTHPVRLVSIFFEIYWQTDKFASGWLDENGKPFRAQPFIWSFGDNTGYGLHGDFLNGWDVDVLQKAVNECTHESGVVEKCQHFSFRSDDAAHSCLPEYLPEMKEQVKGMMSQLPNVGPISVAKFDPCGSSPTQGFDNTEAGKPLGKCTGEFTNKPAYIPANGEMLNNIDKFGPPTPMPNPIDQAGYLGCYNDGENGARAMEKQLPGGNHTPATCREAVKALDSKYVVFAIQYGGECFASSSSTSYKSQGESKKCTMKCNADANGLTFCGGPRANQVYTVSGAQTITA